MPKHLHERRKITFQELGALLGFREMLKMGLVEKPEFARRYADGKHLFDMAQSYVPTTHCGSVGCIGGNMACIMGVSSPHGYVMQLKRIDSAHGQASPALRPLFYPPESLVNSWNWIGPAEAVEAIDNFLENGKPRWDQVYHNRQAKLAKRQGARKVTRKKK